MARDGSGNYTLPLPEVVAGTDIDSSWANTSLADIETEMQDSLSRSGKGGMSAPFKAVSGTVSAPGLAFSSEANSGVYRASAGDIRGVVGGADIWRMTSAGFQQYISASWTSPVVLAGAQTITGAKTFDASIIIGVAGQGLNFAINTGTAATGATTTSELLSHVEAGTWTPALWDSSLSSSESQTYSVQTGYFWRYNDLLLLTGRMVMTSLGSLTTGSSAYIGGVPYPPAADYVGGGIVTKADAVSLSTAGSLSLIPFDDGMLGIGINGTSTGGTQSLTVAQVSATGDLSFIALYKV